MTTTHSTAKDTAKDAATTLFAELTGHAAAGVWSAPGRVNLIGEHTDYNDGFVLPFAIPHRTFAAVAARGDDRIRVASTFAEEPVEVALDDLERLFPTAFAPAPAPVPAAVSASPPTPASAPAPAPATPAGSNDTWRSDPADSSAIRADRPASAQSDGRVEADAAPQVPEWAAYPLGVAWALRAAGATAHGVDIAIASDVPVGAGLSSSAAIEGATASALNDLWNAGLDATALAQIGRTAENEAVGAPTGIMDQMASMLGQPDAAIFLDCRSLDAELVPLSAAGLTILVIDTRVKHSHATGGYGERRAACERGAAAFEVAALRDVSVDDLPRAGEILDDVTFRRVRHIVTENQRVLDTVAALRDGGARGIGELLTASHRSMRDDFEISTPELDLAVDTAMAAGALGARMTGGGFGGAAIALIEDALVDAVSDAVAAAFAASGFTPPHLFTVTPAAGARRDL